MKLKYYNAKRNLNNLKNKKIIMIENLFPNKILLFCITKDFT